MGTPEGDLEAHFYRAIKRRHGIVEKLAPTRKGIPDRLVIMPYGKVYLVELKVDAPVEKAQEVWIARACEKGANALVLRGKDAVDAWVKQFDAWPD